MAHPINSGEKILRINFSQPKEEEWYVNNSSEQCSELFDFGIKAFGKSIGRAVHEEVQDSVMVFCQGGNYSLKAFESGPVGPVIPFCQRQSGGILVSIP